VLAVAIAGLMVGHDTPRFTTGASRLQASAVWHLADFLLQGFVFLLIGQQILPVVRGLKAYPATTVATAVLLTLGVVLLLRPLWLFLTQSLPGGHRSRRVWPAWTRSPPIPACPGRNYCAGVTPAACPTPACGSSSANWTTRNASSPVPAVID
jgi:Sodium/hydrogen exchanger family